LENAQQLLAGGALHSGNTLGKIDNPQFAPLRGHILIRKIRPSRAWLCSMAQVEPLEATGS
jgi:hypothetical protein